MKNLNVTFASKKAGREESVDLFKLPEASLIAVAQYGARRFINDKLGGSDIDSEQAAQMFDQIMQELESGWEGRKSSGGHDPVVTKALANAKAQVKQAILAKGKKLKDVAKDDIDKLAGQLFEKNRDAYIKAAEAQIEAEEKARQEAAESVDLSSLDI